MSEQGGHLWDRPDETPSLFGDADDAHDWRREWQGMPEYRHDDHAPWRSLPIHFRCEADMKQFLELVGPDCWNGKSFWFPAAEVGRTADKRYSAAVSAAPSLGGEEPAPPPPEPLDGWLEDDDGALW